MVDVCIRRLVGWPRVLCCFVLCVMASMAQGLLIFSLLICWTLFACAAYDYLRQQWLALHHLEQAGAAAGADAAAQPDPAAEPVAPGAAHAHEVVIEEEVDEQGSDGESDGGSEQAGSGREGSSSSGADEWTDAEEPGVRQEAWPGSPASHRQLRTVSSSSSDAEQPASPASPPALRARVTGVGSGAYREAWVDMRAAIACPMPLEGGGDAEPSSSSVAAESRRPASSAAASLRAPAREGSASEEASVSSSPPHAPPPPLHGDVAGPAPRWPPPTPLAFSMGQAQRGAPAGAGWPRPDANQAAAPPAWGERGGGELRAPWSDPLRRPMSPERWQRWADGMAARGSAAPAAPAAPEEASPGSSAGASSERAAAPGGQCPPRRARRRFRVRPADAVPVDIDAGPAAPRGPQRLAGEAAGPPAGPLAGLQRGWGALRVPHRANGAGLGQRVPGALPPAARGEAAPAAAAPAVVNNRQGLRQRFGMRPLPRPDLVRARSMLYVAGWTLAVRLVEACALECWNTG